MAAAAALESARTDSPAALLRDVSEAARVLREQADAVRARTWEHTEREEVITGLDALIRDLTVYRGRVLIAHKEDGRWGSARDRDFVDWRARTTGTGRGPASGELAIAEGLDAMPDVARAVDEGALTIEHAKALARVRDGASDEVKEALDSGVAAELVDHAKRKSLSAPELAKEARRHAAKIDAEAAQHAFDATWRRRSVTFGKAAGGGRSGRWQLDDVGGVLVETALDAVAGTIAADDNRSRAQRHADALVTLASRALQVGADLNGAQVRPHVALVVDERTWVAARAHQDAVDAWTASKIDAVRGPGAAFGLLPDGTPANVGAVEASTGCTVSARRSDAVALPEAGTSRAFPDAPPAIPDVDPAELEDGTVVPLRELLRLVCDCEITRVVMNADSIPLDVGATQRTYTRELRRAVTTRDRTCLWPGCTIRAAWSEVHHIVWYSRGGPTSVENAATLCTFHHHVVHNENVRIVPLDDGFAFYRRDGSLIGTRRRPPRRRGKARADHDRRSPSPPPGAAELVDAWDTVRSNAGRARPQVPDVASASSGSSVRPGSSSPPGSLPSSPPPPGLPSSSLTPPGSPSSSPTPPGSPSSQPTPPGSPPTSSSAPGASATSGWPGRSRPRSGARTAGASQHQLLWDDDGLPFQPAEPPF